MLENIKSNILFLKVSYLGKEIKRTWNNINSISSNNNNLMNTWKDQLDIVSMRKITHISRLMKCRIKYHLGRNIV